MRYEEIVTAHIAMKNEMNVHLPQAVYFAAPLKRISNEVVSSSSSNALPHAL